MANEIDRLEIQIQTQAQKANNELDKLASKLERVSSSLSRINASGLKGMANGVESLSHAMQSMSAVKTADFTRLAKNIDKLGNINQAKLNSTASAIRTISTALTASTGLSSGAAQITDLANSISRLGYKSASNAIQNIPLMANALQGLMRTLSTSPQVSRNLIDMTNAIANLAAQGTKVRTATVGINSAIQSYSENTKQAANTTRAFTFSLASLYAKLWAIKRVISTLWSSAKKSMDYIETINLFQTSFKKIGVDAAEDLGIAMGTAASEQFGKAFIEKATNFNKRITEALSLDPDLMMNYQAVFAQMANSMNLTAATALNISESFTLLGNDISSLWNIDTDSAMKKLQAGLAGQIRPLRELGIDISKTSLEMYALRYGIKDSVEKMSQAAKVQLRWLAIMEQTEVAFGDMAKTIQSPANQLRILQQQWANLTRSIGNVFLPVITTVLPYINAVVIALRRMIDTFATAVGFELPDYSDTNIFKDITTDIEGIGKEAEGAQEFVDKLKKSLMSFDELNILSEDKKIKGIDVGSGYKELDDAINEKTISYMAKFNEELAKMQNKAEELADKIQPKIEKVVQTLEDFAPALKWVATAFATYKIVTLFKDLADSISLLDPKALAVSLFVGGLIAVYEAVKKYNRKLVEEDLASRFGEIALSMEEIEDIANRLTESEYTANIDIYVTEKQKLSEIEEDIKEDIETLNKLNWKVSVGLGLTEGETEQYKSTIESFIENTEAYIEQQQYVVSLAIDAVIQSDDEFNKEISELVDEYFNSSKAEMTRLGKELRSEMDNALADGVLDAKEKEVIGKLIDEINQITSAVANAEFKATLQMITVDGELSADSFKDLAKKIQETIDKRIKSEEEAHFTALTYVNLAYEAKLDEAKSEEEKAKLKQQWDQDVAKLAEEFSKTKATITFEGMSFAYDTLRQNYKDGFDGAREVLGQELKDWLSEDWYDQYINSPAETTISGMVSDVQLMVEEAMSSSGLDRAARKGLEQMLEGLKPTSEDLNAIYEDALKSGSQVEQGITDMLEDDMTLKALSGSMDGIWFLMGQKLSTDKNFLEALGKAENAGKLLNDDIIKGLKSKIPDLKKQGENLIFDLDKAISRAVNKTAKPNIKGYATDIIGDFSGTFDKDVTGKSAVERWLNSLSTQVRNWKLPNLKVGIDIDDSAYQAYLPKYNTTTYLTTKAEGGFVNTGELFVARENGIPEMVGRIGNRTAVANNDQITEGIAIAVENAMTNALSPLIAALINNNSKGDTSIIINGREVFKVVRDQAREYYSQTGYSPFPM